MGEDRDLVYAVVRNIPKHYRSRCLRSHFSTFVEENRFDCFHFKHRPEIKSSKEAAGLNNTSDGQQLTEKLKKTETCCCFIRLTAENRSKFIKAYSNRHWTNESGGIDDSSLKCFVTPVKLKDDRCSFVEGGCAEEVKNVKNLPEFNPPTLMPQGNVGTPSKYFYELIKSCRLPSSVIKTLGLNRAGKNSSNRRIYSNVPPIDEEKIAKIQYGVDPDEGDDLDNDECQEFERHEALNDDVTSQERSKERLYEEEMEIVWEKGGSGLVFYTDSFYWDQQEGTDTDERWADDWDVDTSVYYDEASGSGTKDAVDMLDIRRRTMFRDGKLSESAFKKPPINIEERKLLTYSRFDKERKKCLEGNKSFESHTKGVGRKVMEKQGWAPGQGLGRTFTGSLIPAAVELESDAQSPLSRKGLGYRGEKLQRFGLAKRPIKRTITTAFDNRTETDPAEKLIRRLESTQNKWRH